MSSHTSDRAAGNGLPEAEYLRKLLRVELIDARKQAGLTQKDVADRLAWSLSKAMRIENGQVTVQPSDVRAMLSLFGTDEAGIRRLVELAVSARDAVSWSAYDDVISPAYKELIGQEGQAVSHTKYEPSLVPGLFQTANYMRELMVRLHVEPERASRVIEVRLRRQALFERDVIPDFNVVLGELALVRPAGSADTMREQIRHLIELSEHPRINLFIIPFTVGVHPGVDLPFTILQFGDAKLDDVLYLEDGTKRSTSSEDPALVKRHFETFRVIQELAEKSGTLKSHTTRILETYYGQSAGA